MQPGRTFSILLIVLLAIAPASSRGQDVPVATTSPEVNLRRTVTVDVVRKTKDAVVYVSTTKIVRTSPFADDPFFRQFFQQDVEATSLGSGFIVHESGLVVTNNHVVDRAREVQVELADGRKLPAEMVAAEPSVDLAILRIRSDQPLPYLDLGDSSDLMIGEPVIAVGNPLGYSHSVSTGIISAVHRTLEDPRLGRVKLEDLIQTDAAINPGNSGGPLLNAYGQVIGINTAIRGDAQNIGFAIQVNRLRDLAPVLLSPQQVAKVDLPITLTEKRILRPPATVEAQVFFTPRRAALDDPAITAGDEAPAPAPTTASASTAQRVATINGRAPRDVIDASAMILSTKAGETVTMTLADGTKHALTAQPIAPPDAIAQARQRLGVSVEPLTPMLAQKHGLAVEDGMLVTEVRRDSPAGRAGLQPGDVITGLGNFRVSTLEDFATLLEYLPDAGRVRVGVVRGDQHGYLLLRL